MCDECEFIYNFKDREELRHLLTQHGAQHGGKIISFILIRNKNRFSVDILDFSVV